MNPSAHKDHFFSAHKNHTRILCLGTLHRYRCAQRTAPTARAEISRQDVHCRRIHTAVPPLGLFTPAGRRRRACARSRRGRGNQRTAAARRPTPAFRERRASVLGCPGETSTGATGALYCSSACVRLCSSRRLERLGVRTWENAWPRRCPFLKKAMLPAPPSLTSTPIRSPCSGRRFQHTHALLPVKIQTVCTRRILQGGGYHREAGAWAGPERDGLVVVVGQPRPQRVAPARVGDEHPLLRRGARAA